MSISAIGPSASYGYSALTKTSSTEKTAKTDQTALSNSADATLQQLIDYFKKPPAERILENWLEAHHISKDQYDAMTPEQKEAIKKQIAEDIENKTKQKAEANAKASLDLLI